MKKEDIINVNDENFDKLMLVYLLALKKIENNVSYLYNYDFIYKIETRIKTPNSILTKMKNKNFEYTYENLINNINDIAGLRIVCNSIDDVFYIKNILKEKDYITKPKKSGYSSYHIILETPIEICDITTYIKVEIQIRTIDMDSWANNEHKLKYKPFIINLNN